MVTSVSNRTFSRGSYDHANRSTTPQLSQESDEGNNKFNSLFNFADTFLSSQDQTDRRQTQDRRKDTDADLRCKLFPYVSVPSPVLPKDARLVHTGDAGMHDVRRNIETNFYFYTQLTEMSAIISYRRTFYKITAHMVYETVMPGQMECNMKSTIFQVKFDTL